MADEETPETDTALAEEAAPERLAMDAHIEDAGPCRKHVKVTIPRSEIDRLFDKEFSELVKSASVPGFRPGKTPRKLIEKKFKKDVEQQVKGALLAQSLEQIDKDELVTALAEPRIDIASIEIPSEGDFSYEFDVEVPPDFDLPEYQGLAIPKPVKEFSDSDVDVGLKDFLKRFATTQEKDGPAEKGDRLLADVRFVANKEVLREIEDLEVRVDDELTFRDGRITNFAAGVAGAKAGDSREFSVTLSDIAAREDLRGSQIQCVFVIKEVRSVTLPSVDSDFLARVGLGDEAELRDFIREALKARLRHAQEEAARSAVLDQLLKKAQFDLPQDLLRRQAQRTLDRRVLELESRGFSEEEIRAHVNELRQNALASTTRALKQQFLLQKIAEKEGIKIEDADLEKEIADLADQSGEPRRRVRARIDKEGLWETIGSMAIERKTIEKVVALGRIEEVPYQEEATASSGVDESALPEPPAEAESSVASEDAQEE